jgi:hypothetical protein
MHQIVLGLERLTAGKTSNIWDFFKLDDFNLVILSQKGYSDVPKSGGNM